MTPGTKSPLHDHWMNSAQTKPPSRWRRVGGALLLLLFGGIFLYFLVPEIARNLAAAGWDSVFCIVLSSGIARGE